MTGLQQHLFWVTSRAAGITAMVLSGTSISLGLAMAGRLGRGRLADRKILHETLALGVLVALAVHALALLGDTYLRPSLADIVLPFSWSYETAWSSLGIVAGYGLAATGLAYYARRRIGPRRWKVVHRATLVAWLSGVVHALGMGTDAAEPWFLVLLAATTLPPLALLGLRLAGPAVPSRRATPFP